MRSWRDRAGANGGHLLPQLYRTVLDVTRDLALAGKNRPPATAMPRAQLVERLELAAGGFPPLELPALRSPGSGAASFARLKAAVLKAAAGYDVVGFDLFNTMMVRSVDGEWLKTAVAYGLQRRLVQLLSPECVPSVEEVRRRRFELEVEIASERVARGEDNEVDFEALMLRWAGSWVPRDPPRAELAGEIRSLELSLERHTLRAAPGVRELLDALRAGGKRVIFISDMYFSAPVLKELLAHCGLGDCFDAGYSSTDLGLRKATGRIFPRVLELEGLTPGELLFVGDDANSDNEQPRKWGLRTIRVYDPPELERRRRLEAIQKAAEHNRFWSAHYVEELMRQLPHRAVRDDGDTTYEMGRVLAPGLIAFVLDVHQQCERLGIDRIFFMAREGLTFLKISNLLGLGKKGQQRYLFLSRASTILASMRALSWDDIHRFWRQYNRQTLRDLLRNLSLPADEFLPLAEACGLIDPDRPLRPPEEDPEFHRFLTSRPVQAAFTRRRDHARALLRRYLEYRGVMGQQRVALVDVGWKGSMQDNLFRAFEHDPDFPELHGFFLGYVGGPTPQRSQKYGFLADTRRGDLEEGDFFRNTAIFEMVTTANHGSTVRYEPSPVAPSIPVPVLVHHSLEKQNSAKYFKKAQQAIYDCARDFAAVRPLVPFSAGELKPGVLSELLRYMRYPTREEAEEFLRYSHVESFGVHEITTFGFKVDLRSVLSHRNPRRMLGEVRRAFERNLWREAVLRRSGIPFATFAYDAWYVLKQVR